MKKNQVQKELEELLEKSLYVHKEIPEVDSSRGAESTWLKKEVEDEKILFQGAQLDQVKLFGRGELSIDDTIGTIFPSSLKIKTDTEIENIKPRPNTTIHIQLDHLDLTNYNRISAWIYPKAIGYHNFYFHFSLGNPGKEQLHAPSLIPNQWNHIVWEISSIERNDVDHISITPFLMGCPPEAKKEIEVFVNCVSAQKVKPTYDKGWNLENRIAYCHSGYDTYARKKALVQESKEFYFSIYNEEGKMVFQNEVQEAKSALGTFQILDFTSFQEEGSFYLQIGKKKTPLFSISSFPFLSPIWKSIHFLRSLRCGENVDGVHSACHLNCKSVHPDGRTVPNFGGWHDAGDVSQFEICTAEMAHAVLDLALSIKEKDHLLYARLLEEAKVGIEWLLRTRFGDGYRALAVSYSIWRNNVLTPENDTIKISQAERGPFENFCAAAAEAVASRVFKEEDVTFSCWSLRAAKEDFTFAVEDYKKGVHTKRWGSNIDAQVAGAGALAAVELYVVTKDVNYLPILEEYAKIILSCQERSYPKWEKPIRGFFYEDPNHTKMLSYEHRGHEQSPVQALARLYEVFPNHKDALLWKEGLELYREYILSTISYTAPYKLLPGHIYQLNKINLERFTIPSTCPSLEEAMSVLKNQAKHGIRLNQDAYLRIFPIAYHRRGFHATLLSKTKAVSMIAKVLHDSTLKQIAIDQIEWILGKNPFASSTMFGEGYQYHPLYVAFSKQIVGALPVGIKTQGNDDEPYWPVINNAVYKEIWGHTTGKFLWVLADLY